MFGIEKDREQGSSMAHSSIMQRELPDGYEPIVSNSQCNSRRKRMDWLLLLQIASINIGSHYNQHCLSSLSTQLMETLHVNRTEYGLLFSSEEIPGIILALVSGVILVYVPHAPAAVLLGVAITASSAFSAFAVVYNSYKLLLVGRFMFGLTQGALTTVQGAIIARRFSAHVGTGFGMMILSSRLSSFAGLTLPAFFSARFGLVGSMWISTLFTLPSLISIVAYAIISQQLDRNVRQVPPMMPHRVVASLSSSFWIICYIWCVVSGAVYTFLHFAPDAVSTRLGMSPTISSVISSSLMTVAAVASPALGVIQDRLHHRATVIASCCALLFVGTLFFMTSLHLAVNSTVTPAVAASAIGGLSMFAIGFSGAPVTLLACIALTVDSASIPAALGIYKASETAALAVLHGTIGALRDVTGDYFAPLSILAILALSGLFCAIELSKHMKLLDFCHEETQR